MSMALVLERLEPRFRRRGFQAAAPIAGLGRDDTSERVRWEPAPSDHPKLFLLAPPITPCNGVLEQLDEFSELPPTGAAGRAAIPGPLPPASFEERLE